jgi:signal transduction histidine kinase
MANDTARRLGQAIEERKSEIERRWLERVQQGVVQTPGVELTQLRDGMPHYLAALARLLRGEEGPADRHAGHAWEQVAREHGVTRVRIGFDIGQLVREFIVLRHVIREEVVERTGPGNGLEAILADLLDAAITASVQAYVEARDYDVRRRQAENIGFLTHELRNPLAAALLSVSQLRKQETALPDPLPLERLERSLRNLDHLIASVLLTEKLEAGQQEAHPVPLRLGQLVEVAIEGARRVAEQKGLAFHVAYDPELVVRVDPALTRSALQNLTENAAKYTDAGEVDLAISVERGELVLDVRDTCHGLSPEELRTIFEPFKRGRTHQAGTGLGLAIARRSVEAQGGSIAAESGGSFGCHFSMRLPRALAAADSHAAAEPRGKTKEKVV